MKQNQGPEYGRERQADRVVSLELGEIFDLVGPDGSRHRFVFQEKGGVVSLISWMENPDALKTLGRQH